MVGRVAPSGDGASVLWDWVLLSWIAMLGCGGFLVYVGESQTKSRMS